MDIFIKNIKETLLGLVFPSSQLPESVTEDRIREIKKPLDWHDDNTIVIFDYGDILAKKLIWELKYKNNFKAAEVLAKAMSEELIGQMNDWAIFENFQKPILLPVPLSKKKSAKRGYNQTEILVKEILKTDKGENFEAELKVLTKSRETKDQSSLKSKTERSKNLNGCFKVSSVEKIKGRNLIIVDDVITTGATLNEIKKVLRKAGAKKIKAVVVAH